jgi:2-keto-4-pentenoate hydratase/2-oxohepta-3-ene-1,7-dioic acid hydratase in catechol pathway
MKICRFQSPHNNESRYGLIDESGSSIIPLEASLTVGEIARGPVTGAEGKSIPLAEVRLLAPAAPSKIVCVGRNYRDHAAELGNAMPDEPLLFLKPPSSIIAHEDSIELPPVSSRVEHEGELGVVIGRRAGHLSDKDNALDYVLGYTCVNDVTARDIQRKDVQFTRGKSFDTFCPFGPFIASNLDPTNLRVQTRVNGEARQDARTGAMAFSVEMLIRYISNVMTLEPGDLIATGTPAGVGTLLDGDVVEIEVEGVGVLRNHVRAPSSLG